MDNPYFSNVGQYFAQMSPQEQQGLMPVFQNIGAQQANQNAAMQQSNAMTQVAGDAFKKGGGGSNPMAMAMALRGKQSGSSNLGARADMAMNSQASPYLQNQVSQLGSSTSNPFSYYNMGTNGFGNYGE